jgi:hypothetical protein
MSNWTHKPIRLIAPGTGSGNRIEQAPDEERFYVEGAQEVKEEIKK